MPLASLSVTDLRNLRQVALSLHERLNILYGDNGSGKTSLLEAVNLLSVGRSFRNPRPRPIINYEASRLTVFGELETSGRHHRVGVEKTRGGESWIRVDGTTVQSASALAEKLPVLAINANTFELITGSPKPRRQLLDWLAFHVEPRFLNAWRSLQHCLKQRNSLLRHDRIDAFQLRSWDSQLIELAGQIDQIRSATFAPFADAVKSLAGLLPELEIGLTYKPGWRRDAPYAGQLEQSLEQDKQRGYTRLGPHRADITISANGYPAGDVLSRGQQKMLVCALVVAQGLAFEDISGKTCVYLVDDLPAELDEAHRLQLGTWLAGLRAQIFVTGVEKQPLMAMWPRDVIDDGALFHVEQGRIEPETWPAPE